MLTFLYSTLQTALLAAAEHGVMPFYLLLLPKPKQNIKVKKIKFTAVFQKVPEGYIEFVEELPGANTYGATLDETKSNLREAVSLVLEANRTVAEESIPDQEVMKEVLDLAAL